MPRSGTLLTTWLYGRASRHATNSATAITRSKDGKRRWVLYNGTVEASRVPPDWHGWLHHTFAEPPTAPRCKAKPWEKDHLPNLTGTEGAYHPPGSLARRGVRAHRHRRLRTLETGLDACTTTRSKR